MNHDLFSELPVVPAEPVTYERKVEMVIRGGRYHSFSDGFGIHPWELVVQTMDVPANPKTMFYLTHLIKSEVVDRYDAVPKLPWQIRVLWNLRAFIYNTFLAGEKP